LKGGEGFGGGAIGEERHAAHDRPSVAEGRERKVRTRIGCSSACVYRSPSPQRRDRSVKVRLFAALREVVGTSTLELDAPDVGALVDLLAQTYGERFASILKAGTVVVDGETVGPDRKLQGGDEVALLPPVSGG
jgi:sulfur-carrier protein